MISAQSLKEQVKARQNKELAGYADLLHKSLAAYVDTCQDLNGDHIIYVKKLNNADPRPYIKKLMSEAGYSIKGTSLLDGALSYQGDSYKIIFELPPSGE